MHRSISTALGRFLALVTVCAVMLCGCANAPAEESTEAAQSTETTPPTESTPALRFPEGTEEWQIALVNPWNPLLDGFEVELATLPNGLQVDVRCYDDLTAMLSACRSAGCSPIVCSAYRTVEDQTRLYNKKVQAYRSDGYSDEEAREVAATVVAYPGTSEHHLGLAVDIVDESNQRLDEEQENTATQKWLMEHSWEYGFILRYPNDKSDITGIIYEPWHYRYVGRELAKMIHRLDVCLEEFLELVQG